MSGGAVLSSVRWMARSRRREVREREEGQDGRGSDGVKRLGRTWNLRKRGKGGGGSPRGKEPGGHNRAGGSADGAGVQGKSVDVGQSGDSSARLGKSPPSPPARRPSPPAQWASPQPTPTAPGSTALGNKHDGEARLAANKVRLQVEGRGCNILPF